MLRDSTKSRIEHIITNKDNTTQDQLRLLKSMRREVRDEMRAATESAMIDDQDIGAELKAIEEAIESVDPGNGVPDHKSAATL